MFVHRGDGVKRHSGLRLNGGMAEPDFDGMDREIAQRQLMEAALPLVAAGAKEGRFPSDMEGLERLIETLGRRVDGLKTASREEIDRIGDQFEIWVAPNGDGSLHLKASSSEGHALVCDLWPDGLVTNEASSTSYGPRVGEPDANMPVMDASAFQALIDGDFKGTELRRVLPAPPTPEASIQILSVELYADGLVINYLQRHDLETEDQIELMRRRLEAFDQAVSDDDLDVIARRESAFGPTELTVVDDVGTRYESGGAGGGGGLDGPMRWHCEFTPAVPDGARVLRIQTDAGTVEISL